MLYEHIFLFCLWSDRFQKSHNLPVKCGGRTRLCDKAMFVTSRFVYGHWATAQAFRDVFPFRCFRGENFSVDTYRQGKSESCSWVAAFCFAFVSKQMHSCHSRSHWRLLSNVIASKLIPKEACLQIQLFQVSVKKMLHRGMQQKLQIYEFKYRRGRGIVIHVRHS